MLYNLCIIIIEVMSCEFEVFGVLCKINLILFSLFFELEGEVLFLIIDELNKVSYLNYIVIGLDWVDVD